MAASTVGPVATTASLSETATSLASSLSDTVEILERVAKLDVANNGVSLLDTKNDLFRSYLHHTIFLILAKIRSSKARKPPPQFSQDVVRKLVELRLYLERGVRPLEDKLKFSIYNTLQAADDAERKAQAGTRNAAVSKDGVNDEASSGDEDDAQSGSEDGEGNNQDERAVGNEAYNSDESDTEGPRGARIARMVPIEREQSMQAEKSGVYRPPMTRKVAPPDAKPRQKQERLPGKSAALEDYLADEMSAAPRSLPSVGTTILKRGRKVQTEFDRRAEAERVDYEERNFLRLPKESKKERANKVKTAGRSGRMEFGGEEFRDLGHSADSISRLTKKRDAATGVRALLEQSRKRKFEGGGAGHVGMGDKFGKKLKRLDSGGKRHKK